MEILNRYEQDGNIIIEYTKDGTTVSHTVKTPIREEDIIEPSFEEMTTYELQYQTTLLEMGGM